jgi:phage terminase large subunit GpA-like protein
MGMAVAAAKVRRMRTMERFAEDEIIIPTGPHEGRHFSCNRQPFSRLWFREVDSGRWRRIVTTGPSQSGKTLTGFSIPTLYHLFEVGENVICGLPSLDMAADKWAEDLKPVIERSRYRDLLPRTGPGSKGGTSNLTRIEFTNGATLRFMSGQGDDKSRAGFQSRIVVITETDGMDESGAASKESDPIEQLEARVRSWDDLYRVYMECTLSLETGRTFRELKAGTDSRIACKCPHCASFVTPEREHLIGWQDAIDEIDAGEKSALTCPSCGSLWTEEDRRTANAAAVLIHKGQSVNADGLVDGPLPRTFTFGFRWNAANNLLMKSATIARDEWRASRSSDEEGAEKKMRQFVWALPHKPSAIDLTSLDPMAIVRRVGEHPKGRVPDGIRCLTLGVDINKRLAHWWLMGWFEYATPYVVDYGRLEILADDLGEERAIVLALRDFRDRIVAMGWEGTDGTKHRPQLKLVDAGWNDDAVFTFCSESGEGWVPLKGYGSTQRSRERFVRRKRSECIATGDSYQIIQLPDKPMPLVEINVDMAKTWLHGRLQTPVGQPGALTLFRPGPANGPPLFMDHLSVAKHLTSEKKVEEFVAGTGLVTRWHAVSGNNHYFDAGVYACVAGHMLGQHLVTEPQPQPLETAAPSPATPPAQPNDWINSYRGTH